MKLRNKKTGEIVDGYIQTRTYGKYEVVDKNNLEAKYEYNTLSELNADWEDYKPKEPLIKDEKIREFVRAWAEVNGFNVLKYLEGSRRCELSYRLKNDDGDVVMELLGGIDGLENCKEYTIEELCGEEE